MKVGSLLLFLLHLQNAFSVEYPAQAKGISHKKSPKKNLQILLSRKLFKPELLKTKKPLPINNGYTVFPAIGNVEKGVQNVPDSAIFPVNNYEQKSRVKKVLPDYAIGAARKKRSADTKTDTNTETVPSKSNQTKVSKEYHTKALKSNQSHRLEGNQTNLKQHHTQESKPQHRGQTKLSESHKRNRSVTKKNGTSKHSKRLRSKSKRSKKLSKRQHLLRKTNATRSKSGKPLRYIKRSKNRGNNTKAGGKPVKRSRKNYKKGNKRAVTKKDEESRRLIAARDALIEEYPYMVSIQKNGEHWCSGALLNPRMVITTANCMWKSNRMSRMKIRAGSRYTDQGGQMARIQEVRKHPDWNVRRAPDFDVALLLLDRKIKFSDSVHGVDLPNRVMLPAFEDAWITSWGAERRDGVYDKRSMSLQSVHSRLIDRFMCNNVTQRFGVTVTDNFICFAQTGKYAPCTRDTGAPAVSDGVLWGLASWGIRKLCGTQRFPAMFSYLASQSNMDFIANATHTLMADERFYPFPDRFSQMRIRSESS